METPRTWLYAGKVSDAEFRGKSCLNKWYLILFLLFRGTGMLYFDKCIYIHIPCACTRCVSVGGMFLSGLGALTPSPSSSGTDTFLKATRGHLCGVPRGTHNPSAVVVLLLSQMRLSLALSQSWKVCISISSWFANGLHWGSKLQHHVFFWDVDHWNFISHRLPGENLRLL